MAITASINQESTYFGFDRTILTVFGVSEGELATCTINDIKFQFTGNSKWRNYIDISDIVQSILAKNQIDILKAFLTAQTSVELLNYDTKIPYIYYTAIKYDIIIVCNSGTFQSGSYEVLPGAINRLNSTTTNTPVAEKMFNPDILNIFTSRTASKDIRMRESEVFPLVFFEEMFIPDHYFYADSGGHQIKIPLTLYGYKPQNPLYEPEIDPKYVPKYNPVCINIAAIRERFFDNYGIFATQINFSTEQRFLCTVIIEDDISANPVMLVFKNTFGYYEKITLDANYTIKSNFENPIHVKLNEATFDYNKEKQRSIRSEVMEASVRVNLLEDFIFVQDMLHSDSVYLESQGKMQPVIVSCNEISRKNDFKPFAVPLTIEPVAPDLSAPLDFYSAPARNHKVFDLTFDDTFA